MAMAYIKVYYDQLEKLMPFSDAEVGRLIRGLLEYSMTGIEPDFKGNERFIWPTLRVAVDNDAEQYAAKCEKLRENGKNGRRGNKANGSENNQMVSEEANGSENNQLPVRNKNKKKEIVVVPPTPLQGEDDNDDLLSIADALNAVFDAAEGIGLKGGKAIEQANRLAADYSAEWLLEAINRAAQAPQTAWCWRYIEGILRSWKQKGGIDGGEKPAKAQTRKVTEYIVVDGERVPWTHEVSV